jgi:hypothetical protein
MWDRAAAASYLDSRQVWWQKWPSAQRDHGTICISCHTGLPYAMARPALRRDLHESSVTPTETVMLANVEKRVNHWSEMTPFYSDASEGPGKTAQSHSTEAVVNAVLLTNYDTRQGHLRPVTRAALNAAWALQLASGPDAGGWIWQDFNLAPWECSDSSFQGAALLMGQLGAAPDGYMDEPAVRPHVALLKAYLRAHYASGPLLNQIYVLWASAKVPGLLTPAERASLLTQLRSLQQHDGGWSLSSLDKRPRLDKTPQPDASDGYATALVLLTLEANGFTRQDASLERGADWLETHQQKDGRWLASSLNKERDPESNIGRFMADAATGYAVLALDGAGPRHGTAPTVRVSSR